MNEYPNIFTYFIYRHVRLDTNKVFYIGRGKVFTRKMTTHKNSVVGIYWRAFCKARRTNWWKRITDKTDYEVDILFESNDFDEICNKETEFIKIYGRKDLELGELVNMTDGGDGNVGFSEKSKRQIWQSNNDRGNYEKLRRDRVVPVSVYDINGKFLKYCPDKYQCAEFLKCSPATLNNYIRYKLSINDCLLSREHNENGIDVSGYKIYRPKAVEVEKVIDGVVVESYKNRKDAVISYGGLPTNIYRSMKTGKAVKGILWRKKTPWYDIDNS